MTVRTSAMITLSQIVPWGRSFDEYRRMFDLSQRDLDRRILGCADGPASFNAGLSAIGRHAISVDPLYRFAAADIRRRIEEVSETMVEKARHSRDAFVWDDFASPERLCEARLAAMDVFLDDFAGHRSGGRYLVGELPRLPIADRAFDLAVCSHYLFTYSRQLDAGAHVAAARELCRVAREVRVFPLLDMFDGGRSPHVDAVVAACRNDGCRVEVRNVPYEFQRGGNEMLLLRPD